MLRFLFRSVVYIFLFTGVISLINAQETSFHKKNKNLPCLDKQFTVFVHIMKDSLGNPGITKANVDAAIEAINPYFEPICISFISCDYKEYPYYQFDTLTSAQYNQMERHFHKDYRINLYLVSHQVIEINKCGFASLKGVADMFNSSIVMEKECFAASTFAHEMGHFFGLLHTFGGIPELADGSNCDTAGDKICDTPADPYIDGDVLANYVNSKCTFIGLQKDKNGNLYQPDVGNIMSYYPCTCGFSADQLRLMAANYLNAGKKMW